ncbi:acyl-CoA dehydrogenase family protein [Nocardia sp. NPDC057353]|uniref:acyl-CoA dehydrogenase family protein n=1 Tax=Nocardia sp. NPDC057353 TaxID=3346104 RepID=UPI00363562C6
MRFALSPEQTDFGASVRKLLEAGRTPAAVRSWAAGDTGPGLALVRGLADAGVLGLAVSEEHGGLGAEPVDLLVAFQEIGRAAAPGPLVESAAAIPALLQALPEVPADILPGLAEGALGTIAFGEPLALDADIAETVLIADGPRLSRATVGEPMRSVDPARRLFRVQPGEVLAEGEEVRAATGAGFDHGALAAAAQLLGAGKALLSATTEYAKQRKQFGAPIGSFQAVKQQLADVLIALDLAEPLLLRAALTTTEPTRGRDVSAALLKCADAAYLASRVALQVHGAIGYTAEYDLSLWITRVRALQSAWGTSDFHRSRIADSLRGTA